jgi:hypothetical protein
MKTQFIKIIFIAVFFLPTFSFGQDEIEINGKGNQTHTYSNNNGVTSTDLEYRGKIIFTDDEEDVKYISPGGFIKFSKRSFGNRRTIKLEGEAQGEISREYREGGKKLPFEPDGRKWMASVLPEIIRTTGIGASERVAKFYKQGGIEAVIEEISSLPTNYVQRKYYDAAFETSGLSTNDYVRLIEDAEEEISSSYELSKILITNSDIITKSERTMAATIGVTREISSSYEQSKVYKHYLTKTDLSDENKAQIIKAVREISSSYEQSKVLVALLKEEISDENINLVIEEASHISSSYEQSKVLQYLVSNQPTDDLDIVLLVDAVSDISSSYEQVKVLNQIVADKDLSQEQIKEITKAAEFISSDYEQSKFLQAMISKQELDEAGINSILEMTDELSSSYEKSKVLQMVIASENFDNSNFSSILEQTENISSSYEQSKILAKIIAHDNMSDKHMLELIEAISDISSSYEKSKLLQSLASQLPETKEVRDAFFTAAKSLSDYEYGKVMRAAH